MLKPISLLAPAAALVSLAGCNGSPEPLYVDGGVVRLNANPDSPAAGYFTIHGGSEPVTLRAVETDTAIRLEMHESKMADGMMSMAPIDAVPVPAGETVAFKPGGKHLMLWSINPQAIAAGRMTFRFTFSNGDRILADAVIQSANGEPTGDGRAPTAGTDEIKLEKVN